VVARRLGSIRDENDPATEPPDALDEITCAGRGHRAARPDPGLPAFLVERLALTSQLELVLAVVEHSLVHIQNDSPVAGEIIRCTLDLMQRRSEGLNVDRLALSGVAIPEKRVVAGG